MGYLPDRPREEILRRLPEYVTGIKYNQEIEVRDPSTRGEGEEGPLGRTVAFGAMGQHVFMGYFPQLSVTKPVSLDRIGRILVPEHLWDSAVRATQKNPQLAALLYKIEGTGKSPVEFLAGREEVRRRSRAFRGKFEPSIGARAFHRFEVEYFRTIVGTAALPAEVAQELTYAERVHLAFARASDGKYDVAAHRGWIWAAPGDIPGLERGHYNWKVFLNPSREAFFEVLEAAISVCAESPWGIQLKVPDSLDREWRPGRIFGDSSSTPKIVIYLDEQSLPPIVQALDRSLTPYAGRGFPGLPGPSFARAYGGEGLIFYKKEYPDDNRAELGRMVEERGHAARLNLLQIRIDQARVLQGAGWVGDNFYMRAGDRDPLVG